MAKLGRAYFTGLKSVIVFLYATLVIVASYQVFSRYVLGVTPAWTEEAARYLAIWVVLLTSALAIEMRGHMEVDLVPKLLPTPVRLITQSFIWLCVLGFLVVFLRESFNLVALAEGQTTPGLGVPMKYVYWILPLAGTCMLISSFRAIWSFVRHDIRGLPGNDEQSFSAEF